MRVYASRRAHAPCRCQIVRDAGLSIAWFTVFIPECMRDGKKLSSLPPRAKGEQNTPPWTEPPVTHRTNTRGTPQAPRTCSSGIDSSARRGIVARRTGTRTCSSSSSRLGASTIESWTPGTGRRRGRLPTGCAWWPCCSRRRLFLLSVHPENLADLGVGEGKRAEPGSWSLLPVAAWLVGCVLVAAAATGSATGCLGDRCVSAALGFDLGWAE